MEDLVARRRSFKWGGQYWNRQTTQGEKQKQNPISRQRGRNGRVREFAYPERARRNMKHIRVDIVTAYAISLNTKYVTLVSMGI